MTRKFARFICLATIVVSIASMAQTQTASAAPAPAAPAVTTPAGGLKIGIINVQQAIIATNEGRGALEALDKKFEPKRTQLQNTNKEVEDLKKQLQTQGDKLNEDARANLVRSIETKQKALQRDYEDAQADYQGQQNEIVNRIGGRLMEVLDKFAKDNGYAMILDYGPNSQTVVWASPATDVTKPIVDAFNAQSGAAPAAPSAARPAGPAPKPAPPAAKPATPPASKPK